MVLGLIWEALGVSLGFNLGASGLISGGSGMICFTYFEKHVMFTRTYVFQCFLMTIKVPRFTFVVLGGGLADHFRTFGVLGLIVGVLGLTLGLGADFGGSLDSLEVQFGGSWGSFGRPWGGPWVSFWEPRGSFLGAWG